MKISITNLQRKHRVRASRLRMLIHRLMEKAKTMDPSRAWIECSVVLLDHAAMTELNRSALRHDGTTDVITFAYPALPGEPTGWRGEIAVNTELAVESGGRRQGGPSRELALYIAHGCQHLGGADDATPAERAAMNRRQNRWLRQLDHDGLLDDLIT